MARRLGTLRRQVRAVIQQRRGTAFDEYTWFSGIYDVVSDEVIRELRARVFESVDPASGLTHLGNDLLAGDISKVVDPVLKVATRKLADFAEEVHQMEERARSEFVSVEGDDGDEGAAPSDTAAGSLLSAGRIRRHASKA